jgi:predicted ATPase
VYFVALSAVSDPGLVASAVAQSIGIAVAGNRLPMDVVTENVRDKKILLVLDNLEQLLPEGAPVVAQLLQAAPDLKAMVSSRAALHIYGEQEMAVEPLRLPDLRALPSLAALSQFEAVRLFIERAVAAKHDFQVTNDNAPAIAGICERVDGLPLAIELAAARVKLFSPQALLARLETSVSVLGAGSLYFPGRHQTLKGAIACSYDLLDEPLKRLFSRFSVFARGASLEQAESVCGPASELGIDVLTGLDELAEQSLLRRVPDFDEPRLLMLQVIREYAAERLLETGQADVIRTGMRPLSRSWPKAAPHVFGVDQKLARPNRAGPRQLPLGFRLVSRPRRGAARTVPGGYLLALLADARTPPGGTDPTRSHPRHATHPRAPCRSRRRARGGRWGRLLAGRHAGSPGVLRRMPGAVEEGRRRQTIANALATTASIPLGAPRDIPVRFASEEALPLFRELADTTGISRSVWALGNAYFYMDQPDKAGPLTRRSTCLEVWRPLQPGWALHTRALPSSTSRTRTRVEICARGTDALSRRRRFHRHHPDDSAAVSSLR